MNLLNPHTVNFVSEISEDDLRAQLAHEVLAQIGALDADGKPLPGVTVKVIRGTGRTGGYRITVTGPMPIRLALPNPKEPD